MLYYLPSPGRGAVEQGIGSINHAVFENAKENTTSIISPSNFGYMSKL